MGETEYSLQNHQNNCVIVSKPRTPVVLDTSSVCHLYLSHAYACEVNAVWLTPEQSTRTCDAIPEAWQHMRYQWIPSSRFDTINLTG
jgi:hypothetical protein